MARSTGIWAAVVGIVLFLSASAVRAQILFQDDFETGDFSKWGANTDPKVAISSNPNFVHTGSYSSQMRYSVCGSSVPSPYIDGNVLSQVGNGSLAERKYYVKTTYTDSSGRESWPQDVATSRTVNANNVLRVASPSWYEVGYLKANIVGWNIYASTAPGGEQKQNDGPIPIETAWTEDPALGLVPGAAPPAINPSCRGWHQDENHGIGKTFGAGELARFFARGYVYIKNPEPGAARRVGRKLFYFFSDPGGNPTGWSVILGVRGVGADSPSNRLSWAVQSGAIGGGTFGANCGTPSGFTGIACDMRYDTWYGVEMEIKNNTAAAAPWNGEVRVWVNGEKVWEGIGWSLNRDTSLTLRRLIFGQQVDRMHYHPVDEYRYWDDIVIAATGPIGTIFSETPPDAAAPARPRGLKMR